MKGKSFRRLRKKAGSILFVVVIVMAMLIAIATGAYYTAYSARMTVVDNYNYSQLYLSATSISDMGIAAVCNNTADTTYNQFKDFYEEVYGLTVDGTDTVTARSSNLSYDATAGDYIYDGTSALPGMMDSYSITVKLEKKTEHYKYYSITAMANYNEDKIEIETYAYVEISPTSGAPVTFNQFFVSTGQGYNQTVRISVSEITDDAYFKNPVTYIGSGNSNNKILGDLTSTGSLVMDGIVNCPTPAVDKEWYIGGDLAVLHTNADMNLGTGGTLYVGGDLVLGSINPLTCGDVYVMGDLYLACGTAGVNCSNLYVSGNVYTQYDNSFNANTYNNTYLNSGKTTGNVILSTDSVMTTRTKSEVETAQSAGTVITDDSSVMASLGNVTKSAWAEETAQTTLDSRMDTNVYDNYSTRDADSDVDTSKTFVIDFSHLDEMYDTTTHSWNNGGLYEDPDDNYTIQVDTTQDVNNMRNAVVTITSGNATIEDIVGLEESGLKLEKGSQISYVVDVNNQIGDVADLENGGEAVYLSLGPNCTYSDDAGFGYSAGNNDTFNWKGKAAVKGEGIGAVVVKKGDNDDAVIFEMAETTDSSGNATGVTKYQQNQFTLVTTESILKTLGYEVNERTNMPDALYQPDVKDLTEQGETTTTLSDGTVITTPTTVFNAATLDNNIYLFSTSDAADGLLLDMRQEAFCGYVYAPHMDYKTAGEMNKGVALFGGMIVNTYNITGQRDYVYVHPDGGVLSDILSKMGSSSTVDVLTKGWNTLGHNKVS